MTAFIIAWCALTFGVVVGILGILRSWYEFLYLEDDDQDEDEYLFGISTEEDYAEVTKSDAEWLGENYSAPAKTEEEKLATLRSLTIGEAM